MLNVTIASPSVPIRYVKGRDLCAGGCPSVGEKTIYKRIIDISKDFLNRQVYKTEQGEGQVDVGSTVDLGDYSGPTRAQKETYMKFFGYELDGDKAESRQDADKKELCNKGKY